MALSTSTFGQEKHALVVAIGNYAPETKWPSISSIKDLPLIQSLLLKQGFKDIDILKDSMATKKGILAAFDLLKSKVQKGGIVFIHFSSHGQQVQDYNNDELNDGLDECIVPYDAPAHYVEGYKGERHLKDDEINEFLAALRQKLGKEGDVILSLDACHSGTASRGGIARGGIPAIMDPSFAKTVKKGKVDLLGEKEFEFTTSNMANLVVFSASQAHEWNFEYNGNGSLTLALSRAFENLKPNETYRSLFAKIASDMATTVPK